MIVGFRETRYVGASAVRMAVAMNAYQSRRPGPLGHKYCHPKLRRRMWHVPWRAITLCHLPHVTEGDQPRPPDDPSDNTQPTDVDCGAKRGGRLLTLCHRIATRHVHSTATPATSGELLLQPHFGTSCPEIVCTS